MSNIAHGFHDVFLIPRKSVVSSRDECDPSVEFGNRSFALGVIPSNMKSVVNLQTCEFLFNNSLFYIMHRFQVDPLELIEYMHNKNMYASISIGVEQDSMDYLLKMKSENLIPEYITIDVANAFSNQAERMIKTVKDTFPKTFLIAGNCAYPDAVTEIDSWGADAIKVGIANGYACTTYHKTGFGVPQFTAMMMCYQATSKPIISDGGIREIGDISKAFVAGARMVMAGSLFSGYDQSAGDILEIDGAKVKRYFGSASYENTGTLKNVEGRSVLVPYKGDMLLLLKDINDGLRSAISYAGGTDMKAFEDVYWGVSKSEFK